MKANFLDRMSLIVLALGFAVAGAWGMFLILCLFKQLVEALKLC